MKTKKNIQSKKNTKSKKYNKRLKSNTKRKYNYKHLTLTYKGGVRSNKISSNLNNFTLNNSTLNNSISKKSNKFTCMYDPFCYQTNPDHINKYHHTTIDDLIHKLNNDRINGTNILFNDIINKTQNILDSKKDLSSKELDKLYNIHLRIQEEGFPNMNILSQIITRRKIL